MMTLEEIFTEYEKGCGNTCLDGKPSDCNECLESAVRAVNRYQDAELATLRAKNEQLREALEKAEQQLDYGQIDAAHQILIAHIAKDALK